jgi:threonine dehydrogenase-like Zn-dependent dehydrogenase
LKHEPIDRGGPETVILRSLVSSVSRGTERLVLEGRVPPEEAERMRCPNQAGHFGFPVKYGYALVGRIVAGPADLVGRTGFALHPHQSAAAIDRVWVTPVPDRIPPRRAALAANTETALNVVWDAGVSLGDRVLVMGAGVVGLLIARLLVRTPGVEVTVADVDGQKRAEAETLGASFAPADDLPSEVDVAINASGRSEGLAACLPALGLEGRAVEASWLGTREARLPLGGAFHSRRLSIVSSQVGRIPAARAARWSHARRLATVMRLLDDPALDALLTHEVPLREAPTRLPGLLKQDRSALAVLITYPDDD